MYYNIVGNIYEIVSKYKNNPIKMIELLEKELDFNYRGEINESSIK